MNKLKEKLIHSRYTELLLEFSDNPKFEELLKEAKEEIARERELFYLEKGSYPEHRNPIDKMLIDIFLLDSIGGEK